MKSTKNMTEIQIYLLGKLFLYQKSKRSLFLSWNLQQKLNCSLSGGVKTVKLKSAINPRMRGATGE